MGLGSLAVIVFPPKPYAAVRFEITRRGIDAVAARAPGDLAADHRPIWIAGLTPFCGQGAAAGFVICAIAEQRDHGFGFGRNPHRQLAPPFEPAEDHGSRRYTGVMEEHGYDTFQGIDWTKPRYGLELSAERLAAMGRQNQRDLVSNSCDLARFVTVGQIEVS